eukprot:6422538-Ditylum_brightwellii.AAC.1
MEEQMIKQVWFVKDAKRHTKKHSLSAKEVKNINVFIKDKIDETIKQCNCNMPEMSNFKDLSISPATRLSTVSLVILLLRTLVMRIASWLPKSEAIVRKGQR